MPVDSGGEAGDQLETGAVNPRAPGSNLPRSDEPIHSRREDLLGRTALAKLIAQQAISVPLGPGFVFGVVGRWGSGKTSLLNLITEDIEGRTDIIVLRFDPWLFSRTDELVGRFLQELAAQLRERADEGVAKVAARVSAYADKLAPVVALLPGGGMVLRIKAVADAFRGSKETPSLHRQRGEIEAALAELDRRILVVIDDIDRLEREQIRDIAKLVKLVGGFPNVTYMLAYDSQIVARALGDTEEEGAQYLEKIVQSTHAIPEVDQADILKLLGASLNDMLDGIEHGPFSAGDWQDIFLDTLAPLFKTVRDVRRFLNPLPVTIGVVGNEVALVDLLALEALRVFAPSTHALLPVLGKTLTGESRALTRAYRPAQPEEDKADKAAIDLFLESAGSHAQVVRHLLARLFPVAAQHIGEIPIRSAGNRARHRRRVADFDVLQIYLRKAVAPTSVPTTLVTEAFERIGDETALESLLSGLSDRQLASIFARLEDYLRETPVLDPTAALAALMNQRERLPYAPALGIFDSGLDLALIRVVMRLVEQIDEGAREGAVAGAIPKIRQLSGRLELIDTVGHRENVGSKLISATASSHLYTQLADEILSRPAAALRDERDLAQLLLWFLERERPEQAMAFTLTRSEDPVVFLQLLRTALSYRVSSGVTSESTVHTPSLPWKDLGRVFADDLGARLDSAREAVGRPADDPISEAALDAAERYISGELPSEDW